MLLFLFSFQNTGDIENTLNILNVLDELLSAGETPGLLQSCFLSHLCTDCKYAAICFINQEEWNHVMCPIKPQTTYIGAFYNFGHMYVLGIDFYEAIAYFNIYWNIKKKYLTILIFILYILSIIIKKYLFYLLIDSFIYTNTNTGQFNLLFTTFSSGVISISNHQFCP